MEHMTRVLNGTYLREPDGATMIYHSPYRFNDATHNFRNRTRLDGWRLIPLEESAELWKLTKLDPGEYVLIRGGEIDNG